MADMTSSAPIQIDPSVPHPGHPYEFTEMEENLHLMNLGDGFSELYIQRNEALLYHFSKGLLKWMQKFGTHVGKISTRGIHSQARHLTCSPMIMLAIISSVAC